MGLCIVNLFLQLNKFEELAHRLITAEVTSTSDPNTLFRGNSVASKVIDEFMKVVGQTYLHRTLQPCIDEIFEVKRSCEIDQSKLSEGENIDLNMTNLLFFVEKLMSAITSSARSCPSVMKRIFHLLRTLSVKQFPEFEDEVRFTSISGFIFLRFFAPAILNPKLFGLRPENPVSTCTHCNKIHVLCSSWWNLEGKKV
ncbi:PREDICTED: ras GTPase-activating protein 3-like [Amphimedon queenslandica]|uniref:Ras-GAP domain-containing protein n=2 Tax=Amphimedon queenslandica TaxID=400682 RepID=A0AAN0K2N5_AMPQE|nr:PREDICTED: ras GTPase-activating protein 3-like [Amphimedon queenslandica]|eukprot:XP_019863532.1 PREDICTED: ras GTPase-activating protein 3-like [Amphimedon queenslandica]